MGDVNKPSTIRVQFLELVVEDMQGLLVVSLRLRGLERSNSVRAREERSSGMRRPRASIVTNCRVVRTA